MKASAGHNWKSMSNDLHHQYTWHRFRNDSSMKQTSSHWTQTHLTQTNKHFCLYVTSFVFSVLGCYLWLDTCLLLYLLWLAEGLPRNCAWTILFSYYWFYTHTHTHTYVLTLYIFWFGLLFCCYWGILGFIVRCLFVFPPWNALYTSSVNPGQEYLPWEQTKARIK